MCLVHSLVLSEFGFELLVANDVVETASRSGEGTKLRFEAGTVGWMSGDSTGGEGLEERLLGSFPVLRDWSA